MRVAMLQANQACFSNLYPRKSKDSKYFFHNDVILIVESMEITYSNTSKQDTQL